MSAEALRLLERAADVLGDVSRYPRAGMYPDGPCIERGTHGDVCVLLTAIRAYLDDQKPPNSVEFCVESPIENQLSN